MNNIIKYTIIVTISIATLIFATMLLLTGVQMCIDSTEMLNKAGIILGLCILMPVLIIVMGVFNIVFVLKSIEK